jgi:RNA-binding protein
MVPPLAMDSDLKKLRAQSKTLDPVLNLGKNGITDGAVAEVVRMLKQKKLIKIRLNQGIHVERKAKSVGMELAAKAGAVLVDAVGHVVVLAQASKMPAPHPARHHNAPPYIPVPLVPDQDMSESSPHA